MIKRLQHSLSVGIFNEIFIKKSNEKREELEKWKPYKEKQEFKKKRKDKKIKLK